ncbi:MAG: GTPase domain-containing protein [Nitrospirae bacterium]|nr:GTPase domain-containing protein [Nitrospirota bacterium]
MALFNYATKEITLKIVYYGPGLSGKTTNLQYLHTVLNPDSKGKLLSLSTESERTLFFDFLPIELGKIRDFSIRFQLYTVPGQVRYNATRKVVLKGADAVVFVADSQREMREQNIESFANMRENLAANNINPDEVPVVLQYNKRDLKNICSVDELNGDLNSFGYPFVESAAFNGRGVEDSFKLITRLLLKHISNKHKIEIQPVAQPEGPAGTEEKKESAVTPRSGIFPDDVLPDLPGGVNDGLPVTLPSEIPASAEVPEIISDNIPPRDASAGLVPSPSLAAPLSGTACDGTLEAVSKSIETLTASLERVSRDVGSLSTVVDELRESMRILSSQVLEARERDIKEIKKGHAEISGLIHVIDLKLGNMEEKKSWFRF